MLSTDIKQKPGDPYVWHQGDWIKQDETPLGYVPVGKDSNAAVRPKTAPDTSK